MDFKPFQPPQSDHHPLNTGLSTENGVSAKGFVDGVNAYFSHLFEAIAGSTGGESADPDLPARLTALEEAVAALQIKVDAMLTAAQPTPALAPDGSAPSTENPGALPAESAAS